MPEISFCLFDLKLLAKICIVKDEVSDKIEAFEEIMQPEMAQNRINLFNQFGYTSKFDEAIVCE